MDESGGAVGIIVHDPEVCEGTYCPYHNPSDHHMTDWPLWTRMGPFDFRHRTPDGRVHFLTERTCPHGVGHPDPDSLMYLNKVGAEGFGVHGCDGCCRG